MDTDDVSAGDAHDERSVLDEVIEALYVAFASEPLRPWTDPCLHCCATRAEEKALHQAPLRQLRPEVIRPYAANAMTTWGDQRELRHFLPRLFEIAATEDLAWPDLEVLIGTLSAAEWLHWPDDQRAAVDAFLVALWRLTLASPHPIHDVATVLCAIGRVVDHLDPFLATWDGDGRPVATRHLVEFVNDGWSSTELRPTNAFWSGRPVQQAQVRRWLASAQVHERVADAASAPSDEPNSTQAGWALARLPGTSI